MQWLHLIKSKGFTLHNETFNNVVYVNQFQKELVETTISEFSAAFGCDFSLHLDNEPILSLPSEMSLLLDTLELCNDLTEVKIEIKKINLVSSNILDKHNILVFSNSKVLTQALELMTFTTLEQTLFEKTNQTTYIIIYDQPGFTESISNNYIAIGNMGVLSNSFTDPDTYIKKSKNKIKERNENIRWNREASLNTPPDAYFFAEGSQNEISNLLNRKAIALCVAFTALNTDFLSEEQVYQSTYSGLKQTKLNLLVPLTIEKEHLDKMFSIYEWAYSEKTSDKVGLLQNIVNLHIKEESNPDLELLLKNSSEIFEMVKENYRVYIQKSVKTYLDERKQVEDFIRTTSNEISKQISGLTDIVTKNLFGLLATAITAALGFNKPENQAYIPWILYIYGFFSIALTVYYSTLANANKKAILEVYEKRIADYKKIFLENRIDEITGNSIGKQTKIFSRYLHWTVWPSIGLSLIVITFGLKLEGVFTYLYPFFVNAVDCIKDWIISFVS